MPTRRSRIGSLFDKVNAQDIHEKDVSSFLSTTVEVHDLNYLESTNLCTRLGRNENVNSRMDTLHCNPSRVAPGQIGIVGIVWN